MFLYVKYYIPWNVNFTFLTGIMHLILNLMKILNKELLLNCEILDGDFTVVTLNVPLKWAEIYFHISSLVRSKVYAHSLNFVHIWHINYLTENLCILYIKNSMNWKLFSYLQQITPNLRKDLKFWCCLDRAALCIWRVQLTAC